MNLPRLTFFRREGVKTPQKNNISLQNKRKVLSICETIIFNYLKYYWVYDSQNEKSVARILQRKE